MKLTVVRHGETIENRRRIIQGHNDGQLTQEGIQQAKALSKKLGNRVFDTILTSDLGRCLDTAQILGEQHPKVSILSTPALREISFGEYQGKPSASLDWQALEGTPLTKKAPGGESWTDLSTRVIEYLNKAYDKYPDKNILMVTHGGPMRVIYAALANTALEGLIADKIPNCADWEFEMPQPISQSSQVAMLRPFEI